MVKLISLYTILPLVPVEGSTHDIKRTYCVVTAHLHLVGWRKKLVNLK